MDIALRLKELREEKRFSQKELAEAASIRPGTYRNWEQGIGEPRLSDIMRLAAALGVSCEAFCRPAGGS